jgi:dihydroorotate dehydrogenase (fumarate)
MPSDPRVSGEAIEDHHIALLKELKTVVSIPVGMKLSPFFTSLPHFVHQAGEAGAAGVSLFNRFFQPDIDLEHLSVVDRVQLSSSADALLTMRWIAILRGSTQLSLAATGGVHTAADALKMLLAGADVVHMASVLLKRGPLALSDILQGITDWLTEREYTSVAQMKGSMSQQNSPNPSTFARASYLHVLNSFTPPDGVRY